MDFIKNIFSSLTGGEKRVQTTGLQEALDGTQDYVVEIPMRDLGRKDGDDEFYTRNGVVNKPPWEDEKEFTKCVYDSVSSFSRRPPPADGSNNETPKHNEPKYENPNELVTRRALYFNMFKQAIVEYDGKGTFDVWWFAMDHPYAFMLRKNNSEDSYPPYYEDFDLGICAYEDYLINDVIDTVISLFQTHKYPILE